MTEEFSVNLTSFLEATSSISTASFLKPTSGISTARKALSGSPYKDACFGGGCF
jgi:hypothetical protein